MLEWCTLIHFEPYIIQKEVNGDLSPYLWKINMTHEQNAVADPGFAVGGGGVDLVGGRRLPRRLRFERHGMKSQ